MLLNCLVHGETPAVDCVFTVEVAKSKTVAILKDMIKEKQQPAFNHIRAAQLSLWKVSLPLDSSVDKVLKQLKYGKELGYPEVNNVLDTSDASASLRSVLKLAGKFGHTLFVGVDEYDAPVNNSAFTGTNTGLDKTTLDNVANIEQFFKESFFAVLKQGCGRLYSGPAIIGKYFLTGVTPAFRAGISPLAEAVIVSDEVSLHGICGFTESEVKTIVQHYLSKDEQEAGPIIHTMQKLYNGYFFASSGYNESNPQPPLLYNHHIVFHYIRKFSSHGLVAKPEESTAVYSTTILKSISDIGEFSVKDLEDLIINGSVSSKIKTEFGFSDLLSIGKDRTITWSLLYYLGILTRDPNGNLRIPNDVIKSDVLERVTSCLLAQDKIRVLIGPAIENLGPTSSLIFWKLS
ncbi:hypothetical protein RclHR1_05880007 [Rhizophagus clarus]|uniref:Crinkler effector protein N-terminal domain-containing protein n=1 Tax=Rhizophagus clarus TaxID=94130 RepID=A0A2Z6RQ92_9GLOM|nr:hypothetical protein RclHR1_05880007 [Rhizophagus clarus]